MAENFRSRMGDLRQEMDRIASQAEDLERVVQEQQVRLEEMDLFVRQRDEQLAEQQAHLEELEATVRQREEETTALRAQLAEREQALAGKDAELVALRARLSEREAAETALREELEQARQAVVPAAVAVPVQPLLERFAVLEGLVGRQGDSLVTLQAMIQEEMARLHGRLDQLETRLSAAPVAAPVVVPPVPAAVEAAPVSIPAPTPPVAEVVPAAVEVAPPPIAVEVVPEVAPAAVEVAPPPTAVEVVPEVIPAAVEVAPPPTEIAAPPPVVAVADSLQTVLQDTLEMLPEAALVGLAGRDGLHVEMAVRREPAYAQPLEVELADLATEATRVAAALDTGPLLTVAFQAGDDHLLLSPVGDGHFAYLLTPADSPSDFQRAQAILLMAVSRINELDS